MPWVTRVTVYFKYCFKCQLGFHIRGSGTRFSYNDLQAVFFPKRGAKFDAFFSRSMVHQIDLKFSVPQLGTFKGNTNGFTKFGGGLEKRWFINNQLTIFTSVLGIFTILNALEDDEISFSDYGATSKYMIGGFNVSPKRGIV